MTLLRYLDVALVVVAAPIMLLIGVPAGGYLAGAGAWVALRALGVAVDHYAVAASEPGRQVTARLAYLLTRVFVLALVVILVRKGLGRDAGLAALLVLVVAFTAQLFITFIDRPRTR